MPDTLPSVLHEVQRKLGRCMICLQQYERSMKAVVANMAVEGPPEHLRVIYKQQVACASTKTLGSLVGMFCDSYLSVAALPEQPSPEDAQANAKAPNQAWFRVNFGMTMPPERHAQTKLALAELVDMRNDLVHHFLDRFDLGQESGCRAADAHLDACFERIECHLQDITTWVAGHEQARTMMVSSMQSHQFEDAFVHGIGPDGAVHWPISTIVECLRSAEQVCAVDGWTLLDSAITFVRLCHTGQTPSKYGCKNWRQILKKSNQFDVRTDTNPLNGKGQTWYRSQKETAMTPKRTA
ncbi:hypothetical protein D3C81_276050 [compost metagenome]